MVMNCFGDKEFWRQKRKITCHNKLIQDTNPPKSGGTLEERISKKLPPVNAV
jgi:hypothetical protein